MTMTPEESAWKVWGQLRIVYDPERTAELEETDVRRIAAAIAEAERRGAAEEREACARLIGNLDVSGVPARVVRPEDNRVGVTALAGLAAFRVRELGAEAIRARGKR